MKHMLLVVAVLAFCVGISAQTVYGIRAGLNSANWAAEDMENNSSRLLLHFGGMMQYQFSPTVILQPELLYTNKGIKLHDEGYNSYEGDWEYTDIITQSYLEIPVLFKYNSELQGFKLQPYLGSSLGILLSAKEKYSYEDEDGDDSGTDDVKEYINSVDIGLNLGVDAVFQERFLVGLRYNYGLSNILKEADDDDEHAYNRTIMFNFGYMFGSSNRLWY